MFAIIRHDDENCKIQDCVKIKKLVTTQERAESECARLNELNGDNGCIYFWQLVKVEPPKYLVRPDDKMLFTYYEEHGCYGIKEGPTDSQGNRPLPYKHHTYDLLHKAHGFYSVDEETAAELRKAWN